jgi:hypothetical protein
MLYNCRVSTDDHVTQIHLYTDFAEWARDVEQMDIDVYSVEDDVIPISPPDSDLEFIRMDDRQPSEMIVAITPKRW